MTPIFKKGDKSMARNYRLISLTSVISKPLESIIIDAAVDHLKEYKLNRESHHGFT